MNTMADAVALWLASYLLHSTVLLGGVWIAERWVRSEAWRETLWKGALVAGLLSPSVQMAADLRPTLGVWNIAAPAVAPAVAPATTAPSLAAAPAARVDVGSGAVVGTMPAAAAPATSRGLPRIAWPAAIAGVWGMVAAALLLRLGGAHLRFARRVGGRRTLDEGPLFETLGALCRSAGVRPVRLTASERLSTPVALLGREICVPERFTRELEADEQRGALAHELAHLLRRDPQWSLAAGVVACAGFFQPLNRVAAARLRASAEYLCDDWVVRHTEASLGLARCLARVAGWLMEGPAELPATAAPMARRGSSVVRRVERVLSGSPERAWARRYRLGAALAVLALATAAAPRVSVGLGPERAAAQDTVRPHPAGPIASRWAWGEARRDGGAAWLAYTIRRPMKPGQVVIADSRGFNLDELRRTGAPLGRRLTGRAAAAGELAVLVHLDRDGRPDRVAVRTLSLSMDLGRSRVLWLGPVDEDAGSVALLQRLMTSARDEQVRSVLVEAIALHADAGVVVPVLSRFLAGGAEPLREQAVEGLAYHPTPAALALLLRTIERDPAQSVRTEAVEALAEMGSPAALDELVRIARRAPAPEVRGAAAEALAQAPSARALPVLQEMVWSDAAQEVQVEAAEAIGDLEAAGRLAALRRIVWQHPSPQVQGSAAEALGQRDDPAALPLLREIVARHPHESVREEAREVLESKN